MEPSILIIIYLVASVTFIITHILIDGWKSYKPAVTKYFLIDQAYRISSHQSGYV